MPRERIDRLPPQENAETLDLSKTLVTFTGQGSQFAGMGKELYQSSQAVRDVFHEADRTVGFPLSRTMFDGPEEKLMETNVAQSAILTFEVAAERAVEVVSGREMEANAFAGHSLGTYAAMVAAGVTTFPDTIRLVQERGKLMQEASKKNPGSMAAIMGLELAVLQGICNETGAEIGIINTDNQIVITGGKRAVAQAIDLASASKARRVTELQVSGAWHSSLMASAQEGLQKAISQIQFSKPKFPIAANTTAELLYTADDVKKELIAQVCGTVLWKELIQRRINAGVKSVVEVGPKNVLSTLARQIKRDLQVITVDSFESVQTLAQLIKQPSRNPQTA